MIPVSDWAPANSTITFDPSIGGLAILLTGGELLADKDLIIDASNLTGGITISGDANNDGVADAGDTRVFTIGSAASVVLKGVTVTRGYADTGGCIVNSGNLELVDSTVSGCIATGTVLSDGGGIDNSGTLTLTNSTVWGNQADRNGGGIVNSSTGMLTLTNSTVSGNQAAQAGGIINLNEVTLIHSTLSNNHATGSGGGGLWQISSALFVQNSIIAGNFGAFGPDIYLVLGTPVIEGANLIGNNETVEAYFLAGDPLVGTPAAPLDPGLIPLGDYGGPTRTMTPLPGSPAIDAAIPTANSPATDQRGFPRPSGSASDIGAVEVQYIDTDGDGIDDWYETSVLGTSPNSVDTDGDGLVDGAGGVVSTAAYPGGIDIDGDGFVDGEQDLGSDPVVSNVGDLAPRNNPDNLIGPGDLLILIQLVTGSTTPSDLEMILGDINGDSQLNAADILRLQQAVLNGTAP